MSDNEHARKIGETEKRNGAAGPRPQNETGLPWDTQKAYESGF